MIKRLLFKTISIRGRLAYGVTCLERLCKTWNVLNKRMDLLIETLWAFTSSENLADWENTILNLLPDDDRVETYACEFGYSHLEITKQKVLTNIIWDVMEIGQGNLYGAFESKYSLLPLIKAISTLEKNKIDLPKIKLFKKSNVLECNGWGNPIEKDNFK